MGSNRFGKLFTITTWGESHGKAIGVVIDGCPAGIAFNEEMLNEELKRRRPGNNPFTSPRSEPDIGEIYSGVFEGKTTGAPVSILIFNHAYDSKPYEEIKHIYRPGHSNFTYLEKYGIFDYRGGGRASARETACRVAAGALAKAFLMEYGICITSYLSQVGSVAITRYDQDPKTSPIFCPDSDKEQQIIQLIERIKKEEDSIGGEITTQVKNLPIGVGEPIYRKIEALLASAILSIPAIKGIHFGEKDCASRLGSNYTDPFILEGDQIKTETNHSGGSLGGISNGEILWFSATCKPPSSIKKPMPSVSIEKKETSFQIPKEGKHDPCIAIRAVPVIEAMAAIAIADLVLNFRLNKALPCPSEETGSSL